MKTAMAIPESGRGLPHSRTLARESKALVSPEGFGMRRPSAKAFANGGLLW